MSLKFQCLDLLHRLDFGDDLLHHGLDADSPVTKAFDKIAQSIINA